jgi:hypothetical protein
MEESTATSSGLFAVFLLSIYSLFLIPYTISYLCSAGEDATTQPVASKVSSRWVAQLPLLVTSSAVT